jgi:hypothetical protein
MARKESPSPLLELPDSCLLAVLQYTAAIDQRSLFSAARAHSRLHQAAVAALRSITADVPQQQQLDGVLLYLGKHGSLVDRLDLRGKGDVPACLHQLPPSMHPTSLQLNCLRLQVQPGNGYEGVLGAAAGVAALKQLRLKSCHITDEAWNSGRVAALPQLPTRLEHLSLCHVYSNHRCATFHTTVLQPLQQLTYLAIAGMDLHGADKSSPVLRPLQALTRLVDLRVDNGHYQWLIKMYSLFTERRDHSITASMLAGAKHLTRLELQECSVEAGVLAGKTLLQHLWLSSCDVSGGATGVAQLLSHMRHMQQLTHLDLGFSLKVAAEGKLPAAAYAALTASSKLQHLNLDECQLPVDVWRHMFPTAKQLPHLRYLSTCWVKQPSGTPASAPEGTRLVNSCPALQSFSFRGAEYSLELLDALQQLSGLHTLCLDIDEPVWEHADAVGRLTGLRVLGMFSPRVRVTGLLMRLTHLKQLTDLTYRGPCDDLEECEKYILKITQEVGWHQVDFTHQLS